MSFWIVVWFTSSQCRAVSFVPVVSARLFTPVYVIGIAFGSRSVDPHRRLIIIIFAILVAFRGLHVGADGIRLFR